MDATPKPKPPISRLVPTQPAVQVSAPSVKKPYVHKEHLMDHPFRNIKTQIKASHGKQSN
jgi:hypothetical protein